MEYQIGLTISQKLPIIKIIIVDNQKVTTGSFNLSKTTEKGNAENLLIIKEYPELVQQYVKNWETRKSQSY